MDKDSKILKTILAAFGAIALVVFGSALSGERGKAEDGSSRGDGGGDKIATADAARSDLSVSANKCRGCGKCVRIDPEHFALDVENRTAIVTSMENLETEALQSAVRNCGDAAIVIS